MSKPVGPDYTRAEELAQAVVDEARESAHFREVDVRTWGSSGEIAVTYDADTGPSPSVADWLRDHGYRFAFALPQTDGGDRLIFRGEVELGEDSGVTDDHAPTVRWTDHDGTAHRIRFEPTRGGDWTRIEEVRDNSAAPVGWRIRGSERIESVGFENIPRQCIAEPAAPADN